MSLAPDWTVAENQSPFRELPILNRCVHCRDPLAPYTALAVWDGSMQHSPLCGSCASKLG
jgi:hypothetical protein